MIFGVPESEPDHKKVRRDQIKNIGKYHRVKKDDPLLESTCSICLDEYKIGEFHRTLDCNHCYHKKCIDRWFKKDRNECPMCRSKILN